MNDQSGSGDDASPDWFPLDELTGRLASLVWVERRLGEILGSWVRSTADASLVVAFSRIASHHDWHASLLQEVLATSPELNATDRIVAPTEGWRRAIEQMASLDDTEARLAAIAQVADPWLRREIGALRDLANPLSDRDHDRMLQFVCLDHEADSAELVALLKQHEIGAVQLQGRREVASIDLR